MCIFHFFFVEINKISMTSILISNTDRIRASKSLKRLYIAEFGEDCMDKTVKSFTRDELILKYSNNLIFWKSKIPDITPNMSGFTKAKHAYCSNAITQLWKKVGEYEITQEVEVVVDAGIKK